MENDLEIYLEEISHYLVIPSGTEEILDEIKSHILEKTESTYGNAERENIKKIIAGYGSPREVAEKYLEGTHIIAPSFRKYLFRYTWILFALHFGLTFLIYIFKTDLQMFPPLFSIPYMDNIFNLINQIPMTWIYDFGIVALFLFFVTQTKKEVRLPWLKFKIPVRNGKPFKPPEPKILYLLLEVAGSAVLLFLFLKYDTIFFKNLDLNKGLGEPWLSAPGSTFYSLVILIWCGLEIFFYGIRFFKNTFFLRLVKNLVYLIGLWFLMNAKVEVELVGVQFITFSDLKTGFILILTVVIFLETLSNIYKIIRNRQVTKFSEQESYK